MNKMLVVVFDTEAAADAGLKALRLLNVEGDISLYASGVVAKGADGKLSVKRPMETGSAGAVTGLAVGSLVGLLGGPLGLAVGALTGTVAGALRDFWVAGVGVDFIEATQARLKPGTVALVAEIEEEWVTPVNVAMEAAGGQVMRSSRSEVAEAQYDHDVTAFKADVKALESELAHASGAAKSKLEASLGTAQASLADAVKRGKAHTEALKQEADAKLEALGAQLKSAQGQAHDKLEQRIKHVKTAYHARGAKLSQAWGLTKEALAV